MAVRFIGTGVSFDDLMQEGRIALWQASKSWRPEFQTALWTYARRSVLREMIRLVSDHVDRQEDFLEDVASSQDEDVTTNVFLRECLSSLSASHRAVVVLFLDGETFEEIAETLSIPKTSAFRMFRAAVRSLQITLSDAQ